MKKLRLIMFILIILNVGLLLVIKKENKPLLESENNTNLSGYSGLAIMLEGDDGNYNLSDSDTWPTDGYEFNATLSKCENGGELSWNNGKITLKASGSDKCYVYFDKYEPIKITDVKISVSLERDRANYNITIIATGGTGKLSYGVSTNSGFDNISWQDSNIVNGFSMDCVDKPYIKVKDESNHYIEQQVNIQSAYAGGGWYLC